MTRGIYSIHCARTNMTYIGSSDDVHKRWYAHRYALSVGRHHNKIMQKAWDKHDGDFTFTLLETISDGDAHTIQAAEQRWIDSVPPEQRFNILKYANLIPPKARIKMRVGEQWEDYQKRRNYGET